jgi:hypothetical protein
MILFATSGDTVGMFKSRHRKPPAEITFEERVWRVTSFRPAVAPEPDPGVIDAVDDEAG